MPFIVVHQTEPGFATPEDAQGWIDNLGNVGARGHYRVVEIAELKTDEGSIQRYNAERERRRIERSEQEAAINNAVDLEKRRILGALRRLLDL